MRQTIKDIEVNFAYLWYLGYGIHAENPHFSFGKNYTRRFKDTDLFENIFSHILLEVEKHGFIEDENIFIDGTHIKASANTHKYKNQVIEESTRYYEKALQEEITMDRVDHGKKPLKEKEISEPITKNMSSTADPDCGLFYKGNIRKFSLMHPI